MRPDGDSDDVMRAMPPSRGSRGPTFEAEGCFQPRTGPYRAYRAYHGAVLKGTCWNPKEPETYGCSNMTHDIPGPSFGVSCPVRSLSGVN